VAILMLADASGARAQETGAAGVRAGISGSPTQFYAGVHYETEPLVEHLRFRPNIEVGVGDDQTLVALNFELAYFIPLSQTRRRNEWSLYVGAGPALNIDRFRNDTKTGGGFNILIGAQHAHGLFTELKVGMVDSPNVRFGVGYTFR
jgi:hypothetical protein